MNTHSTDDKKPDIKCNVLFLLLDAVVYAVGIYFVQLYRLLHSDGVISGGTHYISIVFFALLIGIVSYFRCLWSGTNVLRSLAIEILVFLGISLLPIFASEILNGRDGVSFNWMPSEWLKLPRAVYFGARVSFPFFAAYSVMTIAGLILLVKKGKSALLWISLAIATVSAFMCLAIVELNNRTMMYFAVMIMPVIVTAAGIYLKRNVVAARAIVFVLVTVAVLPFYFGLVPWFPENRTIDNLICAATPGCDMQFPEKGETLPGIKKIYPRGEGEPEFPLAFMREFYYDQTSDILYSSYGPTCGFLRLNVPTGKMEVMEYRSLIRYLWSRDDLSYILAPDWIYSDILKLDKESFRIVGRHKMQADIRVPMQIVDDGRYIYILSTERPVLARYEMETLEPAGCMDFSELGLTPHSHGAYAIAIDSERRKIYVQLGIIDLGGLFRLVRIDSETLKVEKTADVDLGSIMMTMLPEKGTLLMYDYYNREVAEVDADEMKIERRFNGAMNCRSTVYDSSRGLLYMVGTGFGELIAVDYESGKTIKSYFLGNKAGSMTYLPEEDALLVGGGSGIYRVDLAAFTGIERKDGNL